MKDITVKIAELVEILKTNRADHQDTYTQAMEACRRDAMKILEDQLNAAAQGRPFLSVFRFAVPEDHTKDYDRAIKMLEMHQSDTIEMTEHTFSELVMDDWSWKATFASNTYASTVMQSKGQL